jgi:hypothetical protein
MKRRDEIKRVMTGGTEAPPRRKAIKAAMMAQERNPGVGKGKPVGPSVGKGHPAGPSVGQSFQAGLGRQLSSRVDSGAITQAQAKRTAGQRNTLQQAYGNDWRSKVFGNQAGNLATLRKEASKQVEPGEGTAQETLSRLMAKRTRFLEKAKKRPLKKGSVPKVGSGPYPGAKYL